MTRSWSRRGPATRSCASRRTTTPAGCWRPCRFPIPSSSGCAVSCATASSRRRPPGWGCGRRCRRSTGPTSRRRRPRSRPTTRHAPSGARTDFTAPCRDGASAPAPAPFPTPDGACLVVGLERGLRLLDVGPVDRRHLLPHPQPGGLLLEEAVAQLTAHPLLGGIGNRHGRQQPAGVVVLRLAQDLVA